MTNPSSSYHPAIPSHRRVVTAQAAAAHLNARYALLDRGQHPVLCAQPTVQVGRWVGGSVGGHPLLILPPLNPCPPSLL